MIWATVSSQSCFCWLYRASPSLAAKNIINLILVLAILWCPCVESCAVGRGCFLWPVRSWQNSTSFFPASFCTWRPNLPVIPGVSWLSTFAFQSLIIKRTSLWVLVLRCLHRAVQLQLFQRYWLGHRLGLPWRWMVCFGNEQRSFCCFWDFIQVLHFVLFCWLWWLLHLF